MKRKKEKVKRKKYRWGLYVNRIAEILKEDYGDKQHGAGLIILT